MKVYVDVADDGNFVVQTKCYSLNPKAEIKDGGELSFIYEDDETTFLAALTDLLTWRGRKVKFMDDTGTYPYFTGFIIDVVNITPISATFVGIQGLRILQDYTANYNPILASGQIKALDSLQLIDRWEEDFSAYNGKILLVEDIDKLKCVVNVDEVTLRNAADDGSFAPNYTGGIADYAKYDDGEYTYNVNTKNSIWAAETWNNSGATNDRFYYKLNFKVPKRQGTTFTKATIKLIFKTNKYSGGINDYYGGAALYGERFNIFALRDDTSVKTLVHYDGKTSDHTSVWTSEYGKNNDGWRTAIPNVESGMDLLSTITFEMDITSLIDFTDAHYFYNKTAYNSFNYDLFDFTLYIQTRIPYWNLTSDRNTSIIINLAQLAVEYDEDNHISSALGIISNPTASNLNFSAGSHSAPFPQNVGWSVGDQYYIVNNISSTMMSMWNNSGANSILTLSMDSITTIGDNQNQLYTPLLRVIQLYAQISQRLYFERNFTAYITNTLTSSGITITEANVENYPQTVKYTRYGGDNYTSLTIIGYANQVYTIDLSEPISVQNKQKIIRNPDIFTASMAEQMTNGLQAYYEKDHVTIQFPVRLVSNAYKQNLVIGKTVNVNFESGAYLNYSNLLISKMQYYSDGTYDYAMLEITSKHEV